jgi:hypothetical protein
VIVVAIGVIVMLRHSRATTGIGPHVGG